MGIIFLVLQVICCFFIIRYALQPKRAWWARILGFAVLVLGWFLHFGYVLHLIWGGICWADARAEDYG